MNEQLGGRTRTSDGTTKAGKSTGHNELSQPVTVFRRPFFLAAADNQNDDDGRW